VATAVLYGLLALRFADQPAALPAYAMFGASLLALSAIDIELYLLPNRIIYPTGFLCGPLLIGGALILGEPARILWGAVGAVGAFATFFLLHLISPRGMAFGDVRLSFLVGLHLGWLGPAHIPLGIFVAFLSSSIIGIALVVVRGRGLKSAMPFGPFLAFGSFVAIGWGRPLVEAWLR